MATETNKDVRKGIKLYIDYFENEFAEVSDEELGILIRGLYQYDQNQKLDEQYSEKINSNILLKTLFKILMKNNDRAVAEWNRRREYYAEKDKQKRIKEIMKMEDCSFEDAADIYNFQNMTFDTSKVKKTKAEQKVEETKISKTFKSDFFNFTIKVSENCNISDKDIDKAVFEIEGKYDFNEMETIIRNAIEKAEADNYLNEFESYIQLAIEERF